MQNAEHFETQKSDSEIHNEAKIMPGAADIAGQRAEILHGLNNVLVSILLNAQLIEWKLPSYSRLRRNVHEIERSAQRAGMLLKQLVAEGEVRKGPGSWVGKGKELETGTVSVNL